MRSLTKGERMYKGPNGFGRLVNIIMNLIMGLCISIVILTATGAPWMVMPTILISAWFCSFIIGYTAGDLVPLNNWAMALSKALHAKSDSILAYLITALVFGLYFGTIILFGNALINNLATSGIESVIGFFMGYWGLVLISAIVLVAIFMKPAQMIAAAISGFDPSKMPVSDVSAEADQA